MASAAVTTGDLGAWARIRAAGARPVDVASLAAFRILFGLLMFTGIVRFLFTGWIETMYGAPTFFFKFPGFAWVEAWPAWGMYLHYGVLAALAVMIALGAWTRVVLPLFVLGFAYTQLIDVTNYLNHHYLVVLIGALLCVLPVHRAWSIDAWRRARRPGGEAPATHVPAWMVWLLRFQLGVVYVYAGLAKAQPDWLVHAQPLNIWLSARTDTPWIGPWLDERWVAYAFSWAGFLYDTTIVAWLSWRRTRPYAFAVVIAFHTVTGYFFNIGMFPFIMTVSALIFFSPSWPRRALAAVTRRPWPAPGEPDTSTPASSVARLGRGRAARVIGAILVVHVALQALLPLRHRALPGDVLWNEDGMRFAWHVMVREKHGAVMFIVRFPDGKRLEVPPGNYLTPRQERELAGQPDLILQLARHVAADLRAKGYGDVAVHAETAVSLNGRPPVPLIAPDVDLARVRDVGPRAWVTPSPSTDPIHLRPID